MPLDELLHPIAPDKRAAVNDALAAIERDHDVRIVYACESGSRGWGFASPDSDYDARFVYVRRRDWYGKPHLERVDEWFRQVLSVESPALFG